MEEKVLCKAGLGLDGKLPKQQPEEKRRRSLEKPSGTSDQPWKGVSR